MDGFDQTVNVKVIMATNRADTLDPALLRPGRLDRKIEFPLPDRRQKRLVFQVSSVCEKFLCELTEVLFGSRTSVFCLYDIYLDVIDHIAICYYLNVALFTWNLKFA
jgi:AAA+ superfamily predicted ATPase